MSCHMGLTKHTEWLLLCALGDSGMPAYTYLTVASCMVPCKADIVVGRCTQCWWGLTQHPFACHAHPAPTRLAVQCVPPTSGRLQSLLITHLLRWCWWANSPPPL